MAIRQYDARSAGMSEWMNAFIADTRDIETHPWFPRLVREVAIAEAPSRFGWRMRNSRTYGDWSRRQGPPHTHGGRRHDAMPRRRRDRRAYHLAAVIAHETGVLAGCRDPERLAAVYVAARWHVQHRSSGRGLALTVR